MAHSRLSVARSRPRLSASFRSVQQRSPRCPADGIGHSASGTQRGSADGLQCSAVIPASSWAGVSTSSNIRSDRERTPKFTKPMQTDAVSSSSSRVGWSLGVLHHVGIATPFSRRFNRNIKMFQNLEFFSLIFVISFRSARWRLSTAGISTTAEVFWSMSA